MPYHYIEELTLADVAFEATGESLEEVFTSCAEATFDIMAETAQLIPNKAITFTLENKDPEKLLFEFIEELIFLKDTEGVIMTKFNLTITDGLLDCTAQGTSIANVPETKVDVKAVTMHHFFLKHENDQWRARVILDI